MSAQRICISYTFQKNDLENRLSIDVTDRFAPGQNEIIISYQQLVDLLIRDNSNSFFSDNIKRFDQTSLRWFALSQTDHIKIRRRADEELILLLSSNLPWSSVKKIKKEVDDLRKIVQQQQIEINQLKQGTTTPQQEISPYLASTTPTEFKQLRLANRESSISINIAGLIQNKCSNSPSKEPGQLQLPSQIDLLKQESQQTARQIHIGIMYSDPLVRRPEINGMLIPQAVGDPVDYEREIDNLKNIFAESGRELKIRVQTASLENLAKMLNFSRPTILHFMMHGDYNSTEKKFYLAFEKDGELHEVYPETLKQYIGKIDKNNIKMVFVNACSSQEVAKVFFEAGVPIVVAVHSDLKIEERAAQEFSKHLYLNLLAEKDFRESFKAAQNQCGSTLGKLTFTCCCAHRHSEDCKWNQKKQKNEFENAEQAHMAHMPTCACPQRLRHLHTLKCNWYKLFKSQYCTINEDNNLLDSQDLYSGFACCCGCEEDTQHDESMKFQLTTSYARDQTVQIFVNMLPGRVIEEKPVARLNNFYGGVKMFGRNEQIYQIFRSLASKSTWYGEYVRVVHVQGGLGSGKTQLVKHAAQYCLERDLFEDEVIIEDFNNISLFSTFRNALVMKYSNIQQMQKYYKEKRVLFILDNVDVLLEKSLDDVSEVVLQILQSTLHVKFVLTSRNKFTLKLKTFSLNMKVIELRELEKKTARNMLRYLAYDHLRFQRDSDLDELLNQIPRYPQNLAQAAQSLRAPNMDFNSYLGQLKLQKLDDKDSDLSAQKIKNTFIVSYKELVQKNRAAAEFLVLLSLFPRGISLDEIRTMSKLNLVGQNYFELLAELTIQTRSFQVPTLFAPDHAASDEMLMKSIQLQKSHHDIPNGDYFYMQVRSHTFSDAPKGGKSFKVFKVKQFVDEELFRNFQQQVLEKQLIALQYLAYFAKALIRSFKIAHFHHERLIEYTAVSECGLWAFKPPLRVDLMNSSIFETIGQESKSVQETDSIFFQQEYLPEFNELTSQCSSSQNAFSCLRNAFSLQEYNFQIYLTEHPVIPIFIQHMDKLEADKCQRAQIYLQTLCQYVPSIFKVLIRTDPDALCQYAHNILDRLHRQKQNNIHSVHIQANIKLMQIAFYFDQAFRHNNLREHFHQLCEPLFNFPFTTDDQIIQQVLLVEGVANYWFFRQLIEAEKSFLIASVIYELVFVKNRLQDIHLGNYITDSQKFTESDWYKYVKSLLATDSLENLISRLLKENLITDNQINNELTRSLRLLLAKFYVLTARFERYQKEIKENTLNNLKIALETFKEKDLLILQVTTIIEILTTIKALFEKNVGDRQRIHFYNQTEDLQQARILYLESGQLLLTCINDNELKAQFAQISNSINQTIRENKINVFQFMRALPIVTICDSHVRPIGNMIRLTSSFRPAILNVMKEWNAKSKKEVLVKFELLTKKNFLEALSKGCTLLHMDLYYEDSDQIIVENDQVPLSEILNYESLLQHFNKNPEEMGQIDVLMIGATSGRRYAKLFQNIIENVNRQIDNINNNYREKYLIGKHQKHNQSGSSETRDTPRSNHSISLSGFTPILNRPFSNLSTEEQFSALKNDTNLHKQQLDDSFGTVDEEESKYLVREKRKIPHIITFEFKVKDLSIETLAPGSKEPFNIQNFLCKNNFVLTYLKRMAQQYFTEAILERLLENKNILQAFNEATDTMYIKIIRLNSGIQTKDDFRKYLGEGPVLIDSDSTQREECLFEQMSRRKEGLVQEISSLKSHTNLQKQWIRFCSRNREFYQLFQILRKGKCVNVYGARGVGKTTFVRELGYGMAQRNLYRNGIYYFSLKLIREERYNNNLQLLMQEQFGSEFEKGPSLFFQNKEMLLIFDDFTLDSNIELFDHMFALLKEYKVQFIIITDKQYDRLSSGDSNIENRKRQDSSHIYASQNLENSQSLSNSQNQSGGNKKTGQLMQSTTATVAAQKARKKQKQAMLMAHQSKSHFVTMFQIEKDKPLNDQVTILKYPLRSFSELESYVFLDSLVDLEYLDINRYSTESEEVRRLKIYRSIFEKTQGNVRDLIATYQKDFGTKVNTTSQPYYIRKLYQNESALLQRRQNVPEIKLLQLNQRQNVQQLPKKTSSNDSTKKPSKAILNEVYEPMLDEEDQQESENEGGPLDFVKHGSEIELEDAEHINLEISPFKRHQQRVNSMVTPETNNPANNNLPEGQEAQSLRRFNSSQVESQSINSVRASQSGEFDKNLKVVESVFSFGTSVSDKKSANSNTTSKNQQKQGQDINNQQDSEGLFSAVQNQYQDIDNIDQQNFAQAYQEDQQYDEYEASSSSKLIGQNELPEQEDKELYDTSNFQLFDTSISAAEHSEMLQSKASVGQFQADNSKSNRGETSNERKQKGVGLFKLQSAITQPDQQQQVVSAFQVEKQQSARSLAVENNQLIRRQHQHMQTTNKRGKKQKHYSKKVKNKSFYKPENKKQIKLQQKNDSEEVSDCE